MEKQQGRAESRGGRCGRGVSRAETRAAARRRGCWRCATEPAPATPTAPALQAQKVVILLTGKYAGKKAVIVKNYDEGTSARPYGHALVCGLCKEPRKVRRAGASGSGARGVGRSSCVSRARAVGCSSAATPQC